jgi:OmpA-like transmembrane domain
MNSISAAAAALVSLGLIAAPTADANEVGFYIGANYGLVKKQVDRTDYDEFASDVHFFFSYTPTQESISFDESDQTFNLQAGYRINRFLAIEGAYADLGQITYRSQSQGMFPMDRGTINTTVESETSGFVVSALGVLPLTYGWEIYARAGALFATNRFKINLGVRGEIFATPGGDSIVDEFSKGTTEYLGGVGVAMRLLDIYDLRLEFQRIFDAGLEETGGVGDIDVATLGVTVTF